MSMGFEKIHRKVKGAALLRRLNSIEVLNPAHILQVDTLFRGDHHAFT